MDAVFQAFRCADTTLSIVPLARILAAFVAIMSAFSVANFSCLPPVV
jgi:hypothetical protein